MKIFSSIVLLWILASRQDSATSAFLVSSVTSSSSRHHPGGAVGHQVPRMVASTTTTTKSYSSGKNKDDSDNEEHFLLKKFATSSGEVINPYNVLQVSRDADRAEIKGSYKQLAKRYHPDGARNRTILPGKCNNEEEVREEWERIQIAYNILIDSKMRKRYDRSEMIADPGAAMRRAAVGATLNGVSDLGKGLFSLGQKAVESLAAVAATATSKQADDGSAKKSR